MNEHTYLYDYAIDESVFASFGFERYTTDGDWKDRLLGSIEERFAYSSDHRGDGGRGPDATVCKM